MAFVYRTSKNLEEKIKPNNNQNFYENINLLTEIFKKYSHQNPLDKPLSSFGSKALRNSLNFKDGSNSPGPGSYRLEKSFLKKSFTKNETTPSDPEGIEGEPAQLFISKDKRFKEDNKSNKDNPSPFEYFQPKSIFEQNNKYRELSRLKTFGKYYPFSSKRQISIPTNDLYYNIKNNGEVEVKTDIEDIKNVKNNVGPGSYNLLLNKKNNNSIDWSKSVKEKKVDEKKNKELKDNIKNIKIKTENSFNNSTIPNETIINDKTYNSTNMLTYNIERLADKICNTETVNEKNKKKGLLNLKIDDSPGPGDYDTTFHIEGPIKFSNVNNFGSNVSRGLLFPASRNKIKIGLRNKKESLIIKNYNNKDNKINNINIKKSLSLGNKVKKENNILNKIKNPDIAQSIYANDIKDKYIQNKKFLNTQLGPGAYNPSLSYDKNRKESYIQNFNSLAERFLINKDSNMIPGVGTYSTIDSYSPKKTYFKSSVPPNITQRHINGISAYTIQETKDKLYYDKHKQPCVGEYYPEINNSIEYNNFKIIQNYYNGKKPSFNYAEKRFFEPKRKYEDENQVGKYNLSFKEKEMTQQMSPFSSNVERDGNNYFLPNNKNKKKEIGPGAYRYDSYFDWNKKSYNILFA